MNTSRQDLLTIIHAHAREQGSGTPDHILAGFLADCLAAFDQAVTLRTEHINAREAKEDAATKREKPMDVLDGPDPRSSTARVMNRLDDRSDAQRLSWLRTQDDLDDGELGHGSSDASAATHEQTEQSLGQRLAQHTGDVEHDVERLRAALLQRLPCASVSADGYRCSNNATCRHGGKHNHQRCEDNWLTEEQDHEATARAQRDVLTKALQDPRRSL